MSPPSGDKRFFTWNWFLRTDVILICCVVIPLGVFFVNVVRDAREAARQSACVGRLNQLHVAFWSYHEMYGSFPPAYVADAEGKPMHSWRVLILPFMDQFALHEKYDFSEPWNGPNNSKLAHELHSDIFHCPSGLHMGDSPITDYAVIVGNDTFFPGAEATSMDDVKDGLENTVLLVEIGHSDIHWMEPRDLNADEMSFVVNDPKKPSISGPHPSGPAVVFGNRIVAYRLESSLKPQTLKALTTIAKGEPVTKKALIRNGRYLAE